MKDFPSMDASRMMPHDRPAEQALLGGILHHPAALYAVQGTVRAESFYFDAHRKVWEVIVHLAESRAAIDLVTVHAALVDRGQVADVGGPPYLAELWDSVPTGANANYHAELVRECAALRAAIAVGNELIRDAFDRVMPSAELLAQAQDKLHQVAADTAGIGEPKPIRDVIPKVMRQIDDRIARGGELAGLSTGFPDLDDVLGGLRPGQQVVIGARPSVGKTALAVSIAYDLAAFGRPVLLFSLEMPAIEIGARLLSLGSKVSMHRLMRGRLDAEHAEAIMAAGDDLRTCPIYVDDGSDQTAGRLIQISRQAVRKLKVAVVIVDYLQLLRPENPKENRVQQVGMAARQVKHLARTCNVPVLMLCQLNRDVESRTDGTPRLSDLRESGDIEAHADTVILLHRAKENLDEAETWRIEAIVAKNRNGPTGMVPLQFRRGLMRFESSIAGATP